MKQTLQKFVAYYRVSTERQGRSGLGLEAQKATVKRFAGHGEIIAEYKDVESGKRSDRPELLKAIADCRATGATLLVAKLDRLSRSVSFIFALLDSKIDFVCADMPQANTLTIGIIASLAQYERELISQRTKSALAAKKRRGFKLGARDATNLIKGNAIEKASEARRRLAADDPNNRAAMELCVLYHEKGMSLQQIADRLNSNGHRTRFKRDFQAKTVQRLLARAGRS